MFGRKKDAADQAPSATTQLPPPEDSVDDLVVRSPSRRPTPPTPRPLAAADASLNDTMRRAAPAPAPAPASTQMPRPSAPAPAAPTAPTEGRKLVVGRDIHLKGEVTSCDTLIIEGSVDLSRTDARHVQVLGGGVFVGTVDVEEADIAGRFEGDLSARDRLIVRATGHLSGKIRYAAIVIEAGGQISGEISRLEVPEPAAKAKQSEPAKSAEVAPPDTSAGGEVPPLADSPPPPPHPVKAAPKAAAKTD